MDLRAAPGMLYNVYCIIYILYNIRDRKNHSDQTCVCFVIVSYSKSFRLVPEYQIGQFSPELRVPDKWKGPKLLSMEMQIPNSCSPWAPLTELPWQFQGKKFGILNSIALFDLFAQKRLWNSEFKLLTLWAEVRNRSASLLHGLKLRPSLSRFYWQYIIFLAPLRLYLIRVTFNIRNLRA